MALFLDRIDSAPLRSVNFDYEFNQWICVLVDSLNENINDIQNALNLLSSGIYTSAQILSMNSSGQLSNGILLYDSTNNVYVGKQNGALVKFITTSYP